MCVCVCVCMYVCVIFVKRVFNATFSSLSKFNFYFTLFTLLSPRQADIPQAGARPVWDGSTEDVHEEHSEVAVVSGSLFSSDELMALGSSASMIGEEHSELPRDGVQDVEEVAHAEVCGDDYDDRASEHRAHPPYRPTKSQWELVCVCA